MVKDREAWHAAVHGVENSWTQLSDSTSTTTVGNHLSNFFTLPIFLNCQMIIEWSTLSSWLTSHVVVRGSALMMLSVSYCQLLMASHCGSYCQDLISLENFLNHHCTVHLLAVQGPNTLLMLWVFSAAVMYIELK